MNVNVMFDGTLLVRFVWFILSLFKVLLVLSGKRS